MVKSSLIRCLSAGLSSNPSSRHRAAANDRLIDDVRANLSSARY